MLLARKVLTLSRLFAIVTVSWGRYSLCSSGIIDSRCCVYRTVVREDIFSGTMKLREVCCLTVSNGVGRLSLSSKGCNDSDEINEHLHSASTCHLSLTLALKISYIRQVHSAAIWKARRKYCEVRERTAAAAAELGT